MTLISHELFYIAWVNFDELNLSKSLFLWDFSIQITSRFLNNWFILASHTAELKYSDLYAHL